MYEIPVLLVGFNRPDLFEQTLECILSITPQKLYISIDGPRKNNIDDLSKIKEIKHIVKTKIPNDVELYTRYHKNNVGAEVNVSTAISWAFENEDKLVIFEDDIIVDKVFFEFTRDMLYEYETNQEIFMISGCNFSDEVMSYETDYVFSKYGHTYGWATWKDRWDNFDLNIDVNISFKDFFKMKSDFDTWTQTLFHFNKFRRMMRKGKGNNSWDACFSYYMRINGFLGIVPAKNLTKNIGIYGLHSSGKTYHMRKIYPDFQYNTKPRFIQRNLIYDKLHFKNHFSHSYPFWRALKNVINSLINKN